MSVCISGVCILKSCNTRYKNKCGTNDKRRVDKCEVIGVIVRCQANLSGRIVIWDPLKSLKFTTLPLFPKTFFLFLFSYAYIFFICHPSGKRRRRASSLFLLLLLLLFIIKILFFLSTKGCSRFFYFSFYNNTQHAVC